MIFRLWTILGVMYFMSLPEARRMEGHFLAQGHNVQIEGLMNGSIVTALHDASQEEWAKVPSNV